MDDVGIFELDDGITARMCRSEIVETDDLVTEFLVPSFLEGDVGYGRIVAPGSLGSGSLQVRYVPVGHDVKCLVGEGRISTGVVPVVVRVDEPIQTPVGPLAQSVTAGNDRVGKLAVNHHQGIGGSEPADRSAPVRIDADVSPYCLERAAGCGPEKTRDDDRSGDCRRARNKEPASGNHRGMGSGEVQRPGTESVLGTGLAPCARVYYMTDGGVVMRRKSLISTRAVLFLVAIVATAVINPLDGRAQETDFGEGLVRLVNWPDVIYEAQGAMDQPSVRAAEQFGDVELLPRVDTLSLWYSWSVLDGAPQIDFDLEWVQGWGGIQDGRVVRGGKFIRDVMLDMLDLHADVLVDGERVGDLVLSLDSLGLLPNPDYYAFQTTGVTWSDIFADTDSTVARRAFSKGFTLTNLDILRVGFEEVPDPPDRDVPVEVRRRPVRRSVYVPDPDIWVIWDLGPDPYRPSPRTVPRRTAPRRATTGRRTAEEPRRTSRGGTRATSGRSTEGGGVRIPTGKKDSDDDDDDDSQLLGPALAGVAAVGILLAAGGTIGVQGSGDAPIGLFAGAVRSKWAFLFHVGINTSVIQKDDGEKLRAGLMWGLRPVVSGFRPAFGAGVLLTEHGDDIDTEATIDLGVIFDRKQLVLMATIDALTGTPRIGIGVNLRAPR